MKPPTTTRHPLSRRRAGSCGRRRRRPLAALGVPLLAVAGVAVLEARDLAVRTADAATSDPPPSAPAVVTATALSRTEVLVGWTPVTDAEGGVKQYNVYRDGTHVGETTATGTSFTDTGLEPGTTYGYRVAAVDSKDREGKKSDEVKVTTFGEADGDDDDGDDDDSSPPTTPSNLEASAPEPRRVDLSWQAASDPESGVSDYRVYRDDEVVGSTSNTSFSDTGVEPETSYRYEVSAVNGADLEGPKSAPATVTTPEDDDGGDGGDARDSSPPTAPTRLEATAPEPRRVNLSWRAASDPESGVDAYRVYRDGAAIGSASGTSFPDGGVEPETTYRYEVSAVNGDDLEGAKSAPATVTTPGEGDTTPPAPPLRLRIIQ